MLRTAYALFLASWMYICMKSHPNISLSSPSSASLSWTFMRGSVTSRVRGLSRKFTNLLQHKHKQLRQDGQTGSTSAPYETDSRAQFDPHIHHFPGQTGTEGLFKGASSITGECASCELLSCSSCLANSGQLGLSPCLKDFTNRSSGTERIIQHRGQFNHRKPPPHWSQLVWKAVFNGS